MPPQVSASICNALIRRSIDLRQLYCHAAAACEPGQRVVLGENAQTLSLLIADLQAQQRAAERQPRLRGSWRGVLWRYITGWLVRATPRPESAWIRALVHHETALLRAFEQAIAAAPANSALALRRQLPRLRGIHLDMHSLAGSTRY